MKSSSLAFSIERRERRLAVEEAADIVRIQAAMRRGFQTRDVEMNLSRLLGDLTKR